MSPVHDPFSKRGSNPHLNSIFPSCEFPSQVTGGNSHRGGNSVKWDFGEVGGHLLHPAPVDAIVIISCNERLITCNVNAAVENDRRTVGIVRTHARESLTTILIGPQRNRTTVLSTGCQSPKLRFQCHSLLFNVRWRGTNIATALRYQQLAKT